MSKKIRFYHLWEKEDIFWGTGILVTVGLLITLIIYFNSETRRRRQLFKLYGNTQGILLDIKPHKRIKYSDTGNSVIIDHYEASYQYKVYFETYKKKDKIPGRYINALKLGRILKSPDRSITVRYDLNDPDKSMVDLEGL